MTCKDSLIYDLKMPGIVSFAFVKPIFNRCKYLTPKKGRYASFKHLPAEKLAASLKKENPEFLRTLSAFINVSF